MKPFFIITLLVALFFAPVHASPEISLVIDRSEHELQVKLGNATLRTFKVAFGSGGRKAKLREGDHKTPLGTYYIKAIRDSDRFHLFLQINYPNIADAERGLNAKLINEKQYQAIVSAQLKGMMPPQHTALGGSIGLHGIGVETKDKIEIHEMADWTKGCIAMRNKEIDMLKSYIKLGTKVSIIN